jgi:hypothetical protein
LELILLQKYAPLLNLTKFNLCLLSEHSQNLETAVTFKKTENFDFPNGSKCLIRPEIYNKVLTMKREYKAPYYCCFQPVTPYLQSSSQCSVTSGSDILPSPEQSAIVTFSHRHTAFILNMHLEPVNATELTPVHVD